MKDLQVFSNEVFGEVRTTIIKDEPFFMLSDVCKVLGIVNASDAKSRLNPMGLDAVDTLTNGGIQRATFINESNLYKLVFTSRKPQAEKFGDWVTSEVLPSIRKHGAYMTESVTEHALTDPDFLIQLATTIKEERQARLEAEQRVQQLAPKGEYHDKVLQSESLLSTTQIAKDYGMSARKLNNLLHEKGVQFKESGMWMLYQKYADKGYTHSKTFVAPNGETSMQTYWTQAGRQFIHNLLNQ